jgi:hypothetical protein
MSGGSREPAVDLSGKPPQGQLAYSGNSPHFLLNQTPSHALVVALRRGRLLEGTIEMAAPKELVFDAPAFLAEAGLGRRIVQLKPKQSFYSQGDPADSLFYLQRGRAKLTVVSKNGKEATITLLSTGDFIGEESLATLGGLHMTSATAITACKALEIQREEMVRVLLRSVPEISAGPQHANPGRSDRSAFQLQRKTFGEGSLIAGGVWQAR